MARHLTIVMVHPLPDQAIVEAVAAGLKESLGVTVDVFHGVVLTADSFHPVEGSNGEIYEMLKDRTAIISFDRQLSGFLSSERLLGLVGVVAMIIEGPNPGYAAGVAMTTQAHRALVAALPAPELDPELTSEQIVATAIHETMHMFGIEHCDDATCTMYWQRTGARKGLCPTCAANAARAGGGFGGLIG